MATFIALLPCNPLRIREGRHLLVPFRASAYSAQTMDSARESGEMMLIS
jgi:hypothetical protein